ncbi:MAG: aspartate--tRNA ligase [Stomatobaculum sp.]|nr:aspartate--tRNA ligase [Stomatobaculum sp.]MBR7058094.1 aspartate--tRNA ligase [Stomatobaculum sp.]
MAESMKGLHRTHRCAEVVGAGEGAFVTVMGWVQRSRNKGGIIFTDLRDRSGILQIVFEEDKCGTAVFERAAGLRAEYCIAVEGTLEKREAPNKQIATGEYEVVAKTLRILSESEVPPFPIEENTKTREELRLKYRFLDLRRPDIQKNIMTRSKIATETRAFLAENGFLEIETPTLIKSTPEGARDYLVPSRVHPGTMYALPQSPQLLKQLLMCSGYDRYFQLARCYRDEDLRADRQPEFTQIDMELSFVDVDDVIDVNERLMQRLFKSVLNVDLQIPFRRMTWQDAMDQYGSDKPDLRFGMKLHDVTDLVRGCGFGVFTGAIEAGGTVRGINAEGQGGMPRKKIDALVEYAKTYGAKGLAYIALQEDGNVKSSFAKFMKPEEMDALVKAMDGKPGDLLLFAADKKKVVWDVLGALRLEIGRQLGLMKKDDYQFLWVTEFPLLEWSDEENRFKAMHHPFTMPMEEDWDKIDSDPGAVRAKAYDIVLNGTEIGGGSVRIHQADIQEKMFEVLGLTREVAEQRFGFLLEAFKYGVPPHAGLAYGLDRVVMLMVGADTIRDVIAFPKVKDASDMMMNAPDTVEKKQLDELAIRFTTEQE